MTSPQTPYASRIIGTGSAFPETILDNAGLAKELASRGIETSDAWIVERTGIKQRRISKTGDEKGFNSTLAYQAAQRALEMAQKSVSDIDQILVATCSPDTLVPSTACWLQEKLGAKKAWALDLNAACSGFVFGLTIADQFIRNGQVKTSLVIGSEVLSPFLNWDDRTSCILFGDGAGAAVVQQVPSDSPHRILSSHLHSDGSLTELFFTPAGGSRMEVTPEVYEQKLHKMSMKGREIFKVATRTLSEYAVKALESQGFTTADLHWFIPHQANLRIIEAVADRLGVSMEKVIVNIDRYGNTSAATVPTALDEAVRDGRIQPGHLVLLDVFGAGLTYGSLLLRW